MTMITKGYREIIDPVASNVKFVKQKGIYPFSPVFESPQMGSSKVDGKDVIMLASNNYLGLADHHEIKEAMKSAIDAYGTGTCGARLHNGTTKLHIMLEERIADFMQTEAAVIYSAGFLANLGALSALGGNGTVIITDQLNHMSIVDGYKLSEAEIRIFAHNDMVKLEYIMTRSRDFQRRLIVVDGVYSMDGDIAPLETIVELAQQYDAMVMVDEAHSLGFFGENQRGVCEHLHLDKEVQIKMGTFSKSLACVGGFIAAERDLCCFLQHTAHSYIFNASLPPGICAGVLKAFDVMEKEQWRVEKLWANTRRFRKGLIALGFDAMDSISPVIPILIGDDTVTMELSSKLLQRGVYIASTIFPAVPTGKARFRTTITAALSENEIDRALEILGQSCREAGIVS